VSVPTFGVIGDVHSHWKRLDRVVARIEAEDVDGVLLVGDLACVGRGPRTRAQIGKYRSQVRRVMETVGRLEKPVLYVPGNHDLPGLSLPGNVDGVAAEVGGLTVVGIGGSNPTPRVHFPYEWSESELENLQIPDGDILLCHCPPARTPLDFARGAQRHVGSEAIRSRVEGWAGVMVCGHIHESPGLVQINDCLCMNVGGLGQPYGRAQVGFIRGLDAVYYEDLETGKGQLLSRRPVFPREDAIRR